jgi:hypothetical protein
MLLRPEFTQNLQSDKKIVHRTQSAQGGGIQNMNKSYNLCQWNGHADQDLDILNIPLKNQLGDVFEWFLI